MREVTNMQVVIYKTPDCPRCRVLAAHLERLGIDFEALDMTLPAVLTELRCDGVFCSSAPILRVGDAYHDPGVLWHGDRFEAGYVEEVLRR